MSPSYIYWGSHLEPGDVRLVQAVCEKNGAYCVTFVTQRCEQRRSYGAANIDHISTFEQKRYIINLFHIVTGSAQRFQRF